MRAGAVVLWAVAAAFAWLYGAGLIGGAIQMAQWSGFKESPSKIVGALTGHFSPIAGSATPLLAMLGLAVLGFGVHDLIRKSARVPSIVVPVLSGVALALTLAVVTTEGVAICRAIAATGTTSLAVVAPSVAGAILFGGLGLLVGALGATLAALAAFRLVRD